MLRQRTREQSNLLTLLGVTTALLAVFVVYIVATMVIPTIIDQSDVAAPSSAAIESNEGFIDAMDFQTYLDSLSR